MTGGRPWEAARRNRVRQIRQLGIVSLFALVAVSLLAGSGVRAAVAEEEKPAAVERTPMLWVVDTKPKIYLFGTMHVGDPRVTAHPPVVQKALDESGALYTELPLTQPDMASVMSRMMLPAGESLDQILSKELYDRTNRLLEGAGVPLQMMNRFKVWVIFMRLQVLGSDAETAGGPPLDMALYQDAQAAEKVVGGLETADEQIDLFDNLTTDEQIRLLEQSVTQLEAAEEAGLNPMERLLEVYLRGDPEELLRVTYEAADLDDPLTRKLLTKIIDDRNVRMVRRMLQKVQANPDTTHFVAVGAGHMPGKMGIVELLRSTGFQVRRLLKAEDLEDPFPLVRGAGATATTPAGSVRWGRRMIRIGPFCIPDPCCRPCCP
jgi:uncharacterized protein YbaP (TraB family)